jgi:hypothetical protein
MVLAGEKRLRYSTGMSGFGMSGVAPKAASAAALCALCGKPNGCAMAEGKSGKACWCVEEERIPEALSERLQVEGIEWCICQACLRRAQQQREEVSS